MKRQKILYIGGFELPDKNAAAQRVVGIAKGLRELGYEVIFLNSIIQAQDNQLVQKQYFGFDCYEYQRENNLDYLITAKTCKKMIKKINPDLIIAYNYPGYALERIRRYCKSKGKKCYADATEWYKVENGNPIYKMIKSIDTTYRMKRVHKRLDGIIAISKFLYDYYKNNGRTVQIPPTVDIEDKKWNGENKRINDQTVFVYAGSPSAQKERLDLIVHAIEAHSKDINISLEVMGISKDQFRKMYAYDGSISKRIVFHGRVDHNEAIRIVQSADWSIIIRENNFVVKAGFPTKLVESISCGIPVIANRFSNVEEYLDESNSLIVDDDLQNIIIEAITEHKKPNRAQFDYHRYNDQLEKLLS